MSAPTKSYNIGENLEGFVSQQVAQGRYENASEVVRAGLRLLQEHELKVSRLKKLIDEGYTALDAGDVHAYESAEAMAKDIIEGN